jgi:hypothetical protein
MKKVCFFTKLVWYTAQRKKNSSFLYKIGNRVITEIKNQVSQKLRILVEKLAFYSSYKGSANINVANFELNFFLLNIVCFQWNFQRISNFTFWIQIWKKIGKISPWPLGMLLKSRCLLKFWTFFFLINIRSCCKPLERAQTVTSTGEKNYWKQMAGSKVVEFFNSKIRKKSFSTFFIYFRIFALVFGTSDLNTWNLDWICKTQLPTTQNRTADLLAI